MKKSKAVISLLTASAMTVGLMSTGTVAFAAEESTSDLNVMLETPVQSLDPQQATDGTSFEVIADYTDGLMQMDSDGQAVPAIAESYDLSDDGLTYTFHLRDDAQWSIRFRIRMAESSRPGCSFRVCLHVKRHWPG